jgi:flavin-dependent dehydrogenase
MQRRLRIGILGGGPAGAFCAIWLDRFARQAARPIEVLLFDYKSFEKPGPAGCNMCAGVIPDSLVINMAGLGIALPEHVIQRRIEGYRLQTRAGAVDIPTPPGVSVYATFRGPGPLGMYPAAKGGFDRFLLDQAQRSGATFVSTTVTDLRMPEDAQGPFTIVSRDGTTYMADVVVGAFGVNSNLVSLFQRLGIGYQPPQTMRARQAEIPLDPAYIQERMGNRVVIFAMGWPGIRFVAVTPKRQHVTVTLIGDNPGPELVPQVLDFPEMKALFPPGWRRPDHYCTCVPRLPISGARSPVHDRLLVIGDANLSRYLKNGIESSFYSAMWAAKALMTGGLSKREIGRVFLPPLQRAYQRDNLYGRLLLWLQDVGSRSVILARTLITAAQQEQRSGEGEKPLTAALWGMFTGTQSYYRILRQALRPAAQARLAKALVSSVRASWAPETEAVALTRGRSSSSRLGPLRAEDRVIIVGGGPAGSACAIALVRKGRELGRVPHIVLVEGKRFGEHKNQCAGVLSSPGDELIESGLGVELPPSLLQRQISGYVLHGRHRSLYLSGAELGERPYALRRVELDSLLLQRAEASGVQVVHARATDMEIRRDEVIVYTESGSFHGDVVVGAFALDAGMAQAFARRTAYRPPRYLETLACKIHPGGLGFLPALLDNCIHVFLPRRHGLDFGALIPKGNHIVVIIAGDRLQAPDMDEFLAQPQVASLLPQGRNVEGYFKGAFPLGPAHGWYGDRYVVLGDAAGMVRPFKGKGINCGVAGGMQCAATMLERGISRAALAEFARFQSKLAGDMWYGRIVRWLTKATARCDLLDPFLQEAPQAPALRQALFDCVSGRTSYREVMLRRENLSWMPRMLWRCVAYQLSNHR